MNAKEASEESESFDWNSEDDLEIQNYSPAWDSTSPGQGVATARSGEAESSTSSHCGAVFQFVGMGFSESMVLKAIKENGKGNTEAILETLLTYSENRNNFTKKDKLVSLLVDMGYSAEEASAAIDRCGMDAPMTEFTDFISAARMSEEPDRYLKELPFTDKPRKKYSAGNKRKHDKYGRHGNRSYEGSSNKKIKEEEDSDTASMTNPMTGFGVPGDLWVAVERTVPKAAIGPPYFYIEAPTSRNVWTKVSNTFYGIEPEFVDSKHFSALTRNRAYVHNLPIRNRSFLLPKPPRTIHEALSLAKNWWPSWDNRTHLNCFQDCRSTKGIKLTEKIRQALEKRGGSPPLKVQRSILDQCKKGNLVWVGHNKVASLQPNEMEILLGFPEDYTRGGGISMTDRCKGLANSFQVDTIAYHLSVLKGAFPHGINLLSLFSGIGGAEVALHRLGIPLKNVVCIEASETSRQVFRSWWEQTQHKGNLVEIADMREVAQAKLEELTSSFGGFDLVISGSPRDDGSSSFFDYFRILHAIKSMIIA